MADQTNAVICRRHAALAYGPRCSLDNTFVVPTDPRDVSILSTGPILLNRASNGFIHLIAQQHAQRKAAAWRRRSSLHKLRKPIGDPHGKRYRLGLKTDRRSDPMRQSACRLLQVDTTRGRCGLAFLGRHFGPRHTLCPTSSISSAGRSLEISRAGIKPAQALTRVK
jgi:hypothetical protein